MRRALLSAALLALLADCAAATPRRATEPEPEPRMDDHRTADAMHEELVERQSEIASRIEATDCDGACGAVARICQLGRALCRISERHGGDVELEGHCADGRERCGASQALLRTTPCDCAPSEVP